MTAVGGTLALLTAGVGNSARIPAWSDGAASPGFTMPKRVIDSGASSFDHT
jgi:hypothetical protein